MFLEWRPPLEASCRSPPKENGSWVNSADLQSLRSSVCASSARVLPRTLLSIATSSLSPAFTNNVS